MKLINFNLINYILFYIKMNILDKKVIYDIIDNKVYGIINNNYGNSYITHSNKSILDIYVNDYYDNMIKTYDSYNLKLLFNALKLNTNLKLLKLIKLCDYSNFSRLFDLDLLCDSLKNNKKLKYLELSENGLYNINSLSKIFINSKIKFLDLSYNEITDLTVIIHFLENNNTLQYLYLNHNCIDDYNLNLLCKVLENNNTLQYLDLSYNKDITNLYPIIKLLEKNKFIKSIKLDTESSCVAAAIIDIENTITKIDKRFKYDFIS